MPTTAARAGGAFPPVTAGAALSRPGGGAGLSETATADARPTP